MLIIFCLITEVALSKKKTEPLITHVIVADDKAVVGSRTEVNDTLVLPVYKPKDEYVKQYFDGLMNFIGRDGQWIEETEPEMVSGTRFKDQFEPPYNVIVNNNVFRSEIEFMFAGFCVGTSFDYDIVGNYSVGDFNFLITATMLPMMTAIPNKTAAIAMNYQTVTYTKRPWPYRLPFKNYRIDINRYAPVRVSDNIFSDAVYLGDTDSLLVYGLPGGRVLDTISIRDKKPRIRIVSKNWATEHIGEDLGREDGYVIPSSGYYGALILDERDSTLICRGYIPGSTPLFVTGADGSQQPVIDYNSHQIITPANVRQYGRRNPDGYQKRGNGSTWGLYGTVADESSAVRCIRGDGLCDSVIVDIDGPLAHSIDVRLPEVTLDSAYWQGTVLARVLHVMCDSDSLDVPGMYALYLDVADGGGLRASFRAYEPTEFLSSVYPGLPAPVGMMMVSVGGAQYPCPVMRRCNPIFSTEP